MTQSRHGQFSSSQVSALMSNGKTTGSEGVPFYKYIDQKKNEIKAGRQLSNQVRAVEFDWGNMCEAIAFAEINDFDYQLVSEKFRYQHPTFALTGVPDYLVKSKKKVGDIKCPWTLNSFFDLIKLDTAQKLEKEKPEYFWQLVSNAILTGSEVCELAIFMPTKSMISTIQHISEQSLMNEDSTKHYYFHKKNINEMPWTLDMATIHKMEFALTSEMVERFNFRLEKATNLLRT